MMGLGDLLKSLLIGASSGGQLFLPRSVGRTDILKHAVNVCPQLRSLWWAFTFS